MSDTHYKTARKLIRDTPTTGFNPQSVIKDSNLTFYNNSFAQKRKTQSKRYANANQSQFNNKTIDFSDFKSHRKTLSMGKQNQLHPLPEIKIPKNKRGAKKGTFLQIWLNEALDEGSNQSVQNQNVSVNDQTLGALKSYGLEKKILKSKNISQETIDKIYKKLYVYTKGLSMTFDEVERLASVKYQNDSEGNQGNGITQIFWKAFTKLLQNESPFETAFQFVQRGHIKTIKELREKMRQLRQEQQSMKKGHQQEVRKFQREAQQMLTRQKQLENDFQITKATLQLTDKTLEEEILLRLKFEEKINSVYCSYEEIKDKYGALVEELKIKKENSVETEMREKSLKQQLENMTVTCQELEHLLSLQKARNRDFRTQLVIKSQQRTELQRQMLDREQLKEKESDEISQQLQRNKLLLSLLNEAGAEKERVRQLLEQQKKINQKFAARIEDLGQINNRLYAEKYQIHNNLQQANELNVSLVKQIKNKTQSLQQLTQQLNTIKQQVDALNNELSHEKAIKTDLAEQLQIKTQLLLSTQSTLQKLKEVKDRHQRLQKIAEHDRDIAIQQKFSAMSKLQLQQHQLQTITDELQQLKQESEILVNKLNKSNELIKKRVGDLEEQINKKEKAIVTHLNTVQIERITVMKREKQIEMLKERLESKDSNIYNLQASKVYLQTNQPIIQGKLHQKEQELKAQAQQFIQNLTKQASLNSQIASLEGLLSVKTNETHVETQAYKKLSQHYKLMFISRRNYIHPMVHEDTLSLLNRLTLKMHLLTREITSIEAFKQQSQDNLNRLLQENLNLKHTISTLQSKLAQLSQRNHELSQCNHSLQTQKDDLFKTLHQQTHKIQQLSQSEKILKNQLANRNRIDQQFQQLLASNTLTIHQLQNHIQVKTQLIDQLSNQNHQIKAQYQLALNQTQQLKAKLDKNYRKSQQKSTKLPASTQKKREQTCQKQVQTQVALFINRQQNMSSKFRTVQQTVKNRQTTPILRQRFSPESKQIVQQLLNETQEQDYKQQQVPMKEIAEFQGEEQAKPARHLMNGNNKSISHGKDKYLSPQGKSDKKRVQKKQFQRAFKLTFMRR